MYLQIVRSGSEPHYSSQLFCWILFLFSIISESFLFPISLSIVTIFTLLSGGWLAVSLFIHLSAGAVE